MREKENQAVSAITVVDLIKSMFCLYQKLKQDNNLNTLSRKEE